MPTTTLTIEDWKSILLDCKWSDRSWRILGYFHREGDREVRVREIGKLLGISHQNPTSSPFSVINSGFRKQKIPYRLSIRSKGIPNFTDCYYTLRKIE